MDIQAGGNEENGDNSFLNFTIYVTMCLFRTKKGTCTP